MDDWPAYWGRPCWYEDETAPARRLKQARDVVASLSSNDRAELRNLRVTLIEWAGSNPVRLKVLKALAVLKDDYIKGF